MAPRTVMGRLVTAVWIVISVIAATSLVAGIASTLTLTGIGVEVIATADQLRGRNVAALFQSPGEAFATRHGARVRRVDSLADGYQLLEQRTVDALVYDRPQLQYFLTRQNPLGLAVSPAEYEQQNYGFALALDSKLQHDLNLQVLRLRESGMIDRIAGRWLGEE
jgi:polar amino acid transport system substrate-binding protein